MTPEQIERRAEARMDRLDAGLMKGMMTQAEYDAAVKALDRDTERQWREFSRLPAGYFNPSKHGG